MSDLLSWLHQTPQEAEPPAIELPENWPHEGRIELRNVSAKYGPNMPDVLVNVSLTVNPQDKVCIFGRTGSGKSTFLLAILGFLEYSGKIEIDGIDIATVPRHILRSRIISISQEQVELDGTIRSNLLPYEPTVPDGETEADRVASVADIDAYLQEFLSHIGIWTEIQDKGGLYTTLGSAGLSKVMIKTLCFARAVLRYHRSEGRLVLLDEATNGLDPEQDTAVQKSIWRFFEGCSIVQIAHLKESTEDSELSVEISGGKIVHVQRGPELLPGVESRSRPLMSPDSMIMSAGSESATPNRVSSPGDQMMPPDDDTLSLDRQIIPDIPALEPLDDDLVPPDELMLSLRDHMMSPRFAPPSDSGIVPPGAHRVPSIYRSTPSVSGVSTSIAPNQSQATNYGKLWVSSAAFSNKLQQYGQMPDAQGSYNTAQNDIPTFDYESTLDCDYPRAFGRGPNPFVAPAKDAALHHGYADNQHSGYRYQPAPNYQPMPNYSTAPSQYPSASYQPVPDHSQSTHIQDSSVSLQPMPDRGPLTNFNRILDYGLRSRSGAESNTGDPSTSGDASSYYSGSSYESGSARSVRMFH
ncbi:ATPase, AAA+ type, core [Akanthomyces lecanii RCEF 1005]|uniref:ATPase, AAA+ type, core n=1 Tax=Akanthomyces lecanii RCEF 1005 TaxID=1081108 RepID=A0A168C6L0_CORDF|nr:ATPase, AAA+ type, core [Akanthomyces lecanii RCEF 1005]